jgi:hypothetical protein
VSFWQRSSVFAVLLSAIAALCAPVRAESPLRRVDFERDIQPILADNCFHCHGPDSARRKGDLRFDQLDPTEGPLAPRDGYAIVVPGNVEESVLVMRITADDADVRMPPPDSNRKLTPEQIELLQRWVAEGAEWGRHWSLVAPKRPAVPAVKDTSGLKNPIDAFLGSRLEHEGIVPLPEAPREALIRRVTLDLTGLPPTPAEVETFVADAAPDAYEKLVDRLLASPRYGERMVWEWLDAARYADTNGYQGDPTRTMWPWRDWVVRAMNENLPYDQFVTWQIAGDLLPGATQDQRLASGFNRAHTFNGEGGRIPEETRVENVMDRVDTTGTAFLGLTLGCARCHDHKYDPISQREYYQFFAYFNQSSETGGFQYVNGGNVLPVMTVTSPPQQQQLDALQRDVETAEVRLAAEQPKLDAAQAAWEAQARSTAGWIVTAPASTVSTGGATMQPQGDYSILVGGTSPETDVHEIVLRTPLQSVSGLRLEVLPDASLSQGGPGRSVDSGNFVLTNIEATAVSVADPQQTKSVKFSTADATFSQGGFPVAGAIDGDPTKTGWAVWKAPDKSNLAAVFSFAEPVSFPGGAELRLKLHYASEHKLHTAGRFRLAVTGGPVMLPEVATALAIAADARTKSQTQHVRRFFRDRVSPEFRSLNEAVAGARKAVKDFEASLAKVMVMNDAMPRETHVLAKGSYDKPTEKVEPGVLGILHPLPSAPADSTSNRLALAKWLTDPANPLLGRVTVNRYWQQLFGTGIVKTVEDFGVQGERPVHPELLDWLAVEFRESGWDVKAMHRLMVTSAAYRRSSKIPPEMLERDPENRLLARGPRFRLPSVVIRDQALAAGGLLVEQLGGPPVRSYQPPGIWEEATFGQIKYKQDHGDALYRRGLYLFWRRIVGPTELFDTGSRTVCTVTQSRTNTPLHALTTLNDTTFVEAARALAERVMTQSSTPEARLREAYRFVLARGPSDSEQSVLLASLNRLKTQYAGDREAALKLLAVGESKRDEKLDPVEHAAYTGVCLAILNLDEALTKE